MQRETPVPIWAVGVLLLFGSALILLGANLGWLEPFHRSWPLFLSLAGVALVAGGGIRFLVVAGLLFAGGILGEEHYAGRLEFSRHWPWLLAVAAVLVAADRILDRSRAGGPAA